MAGTIFFVRNGAIKLTYDSSQCNNGEPRTIVEGGCFGEDTIHKQSHIPNYSAVALAKTVIGVINFQSIQSVIEDTARLRGLSIRFINRSIQLSDLKKNRLLGVGTLYCCFIYCYFI